MPKHDCPDCKCVDAPVAHKHYFAEMPSYIISTGEGKERVWMCANKNDGYCMESKRKTGAN